MEPAPPVEILGKTYDALADGVYDAIFLGTGLKECILAGLLSVKGWKVLVLDRNDYYGGECASLNLEGLFKAYKGKELTDGDIKKLGKNRDYNIDLIPKFIMSCGNLVKMLYTTKVTRYLDFKVVEGSYVFSGGKKEVHKVPSTLKEAAITPLVGFFQKRKLKNFLQYLSDSKVPGDDGVPEGSKVDSDDFTMNDMYKKFDLDDMAQDFIGHAMALHLNDDYKTQPATQSFKALKLYGYSVDKYGKSPYLYPLYGLGGLPEGFSRLCAVHGGVFMLNQKPDSILYDNGKACGVIIGKEAAKAKLIVGDPSYFPEDRTVVKGKVIRSICIMNHPIKGTNDAKSAQIIIPSNQVSEAGFKSRRNDIYISCVSFDHNVAPSNIWIAIVSTKAETKDPKSEIECGILVLGSILDRIDIISDYKESAKSSKEDNCFVTSSYDATSHFETTAEDVLIMYKEITGEDVDLTITPEEDE